MVWVRIFAIKLTIAVLVALAASASAAGSVPPAAVEAGLAARANQARQEAAVATLAAAADLTSGARKHAERMAARGDIYHDPNLGRSVSGWETVGENVGVTSASAAAAGRLHGAFMESPSHRRNLLDPRFTQYGFAAVVSGDDVYVVQRFRQPIQRTSSPALATPPATDPAPSDSAATGATSTEPVATFDAADSALGSPPQPTPEVVVLGARLDLLDPGPNDHPLRKALPPLLLLVAFGLLLWNVASVSFIVGRRGRAPTR